MCIGTAADSTRIICIYEGEGKPGSQRTLDAFKDYIKERSILIHDDENSHSLLIDTLKLIEITYKSADLKDLSDDDNPLDRINDVHNLLKFFLDSHSGFLRKHIQGYLDLFVFIMNPPYNKLKKAELFIDMAIRSKNTLRYREFYKTDTTIPAEDSEE